MGLFKNIYLKHRIQWFCDNCEAHLNKQDNFSVKTGRWECSKCSYNNDVSLEYVGKGNKLEQDKEKSRQHTVCKFNGNISYERFSFIAHSIAKQIKRLEVKVEGPIISGTVSTVSGIDTWDFKVDFNDFGDITGKYWWVCHGNYDSSIPEAFVKKMSKLIIEENEYLANKKSNERTANSNQKKTKIEKLLETLNEEQRLIANALIYFASNDIKDPHEMEDYIAKTNIKGVGIDKTINQILESLSEEQETALYTAIGMVADNESDTTEDIELTIYEVIETFNTEQKKMLDKILETVIKYPKMETFDEFFNRVNGYDVGGGRLIKEVYKTLNDIQKLALTKYVEYVVNDYETED